MPSRAELVIDLEVAKRRYFEAAFPLGGMSIINPETIALRQRLVEAAAALAAWKPVPPLPWYKRWFRSL